MSHVHVWEEGEVSVGPPSAETWGPAAAGMLDDPEWGPVVREAVESGGMPLSDAEAEEHFEVIGRCRTCECGAVEVLEDGEWRRLA